MSRQAITAAHAALSKEVRDVPWASNCAGEIFILDNEGNDLRIGHFQGDEALAAFVVKVHNSMLEGDDNSQSTRAA